jgi:adenylate kinase
MKLIEDFSIGLTGSPGTGKKTIGRTLSRITGLEFVSINDYAVKNRMGRRVGSEFSVDAKRLYGRIETKGRVVSGHLLPYVVPNRQLDLVVLLRCSPNVLKRRYASRDYSIEKMRENIEAEMIGVLAAACLEEYDLQKIVEFDTTRAKPESTSKRVLDIIKGKERPTFGSVDWLSATHSSFTRALGGKYNRFNTPKKITRFANPKARKSRYYSLMKGELCE